MKIMSMKEFADAARKKFGDNSQLWMYKCPKCGTEQCLKDLVDVGLTKEDAIKYIGFSCIGRFKGATNGCDWTLGGLFRIHTLEIQTVDGEKHSHFELA